MFENNVEHGIPDEKTPLHVSEFKRFRRVFFSRKLVIFGITIILLAVIIAVFAPFIAPYNPNRVDLSVRLAGPSIKHWLGTDSVGRDVLSRLIYGSRISLLVSVIAIIISSSIGMFLGLLAGYYEGLVNTVIMRIIDSLMSVPMLLLAITLAAVLGSGIVNIVIALGVAMVPTYARLMCGQALTIKQNEYVLAGHSIGASNLRIMLRHVFPNCLPPLIVMMTLQLGTAILTEAGLSFLGVGINPPTASWGNMVREGYNYLKQDWMLTLPPGIAIMLVVFSFNMVGDGLRDALDPRLRGTL